MGYNVGDIVKIREWDEMKREYGVDPDGDIPTPLGVFFVSGMRGLCGQYVEIASVVNSEEYRVSQEDGGWWVTDYMIDSAFESRNKDIGTLDIGVVDIPDCVFDDFLYQ